MIALIQELGPPVQAFRRDRPVCRSLWKSCRSVYILRAAVRTPSDIVSSVDVLPHKVNRLMNQFQICVRDFRQIFSVLLNALLRVFSQKNRVGKPRHIPCPVLDRLVKAKINAPCRLDILWLVCIRIRHAAGRCKADLYRLLCVFSKLLHRHTVGAQRIVRDLKYLFGRKLQSRRVDTA